MEVLWIIAYCVLTGVVITVVDVLLDVEEKGTTFALLIHRTAVIMAGFGLARLSDYLRF